MYIRPPPSTAPPYPMRHPLPPATQYWCIHDHRGPHRPGPAAGRGGAAPRPATPAYDSPQGAGHTEGASGCTYVHAASAGGAGRASLYEWAGSGVSPGAPVHTDRVLGASKGGPESHDQLTALADGVQDDIRRPVHVQDQAGPQAVCPLQPLGPLHEGGGGRDRFFRPAKTVPDS
jgi:hypothetical protein